MKTSNWINVRKNHETTALLSGIHKMAFVKEEGMKEGAFVYQPIEEYSNDMYRFEGVSENLFERLVQNQQNPRQFRSIFNDEIVFSKKTKRKIEKSG